MVGYAMGDGRGDRFEAVEGNIYRWSFFIIFVYCGGEIAWISVYLSFYLFIIVIAYS